MRRRWAVRLGTLAVLTLALYLLLWVAGYDPHPGRLVLLSAVGGAASWLVGDLLGYLGPGWAVHSEASVLPERHDHRLNAYLRTVEGHLTSSAPDPALRDRLARLADHRLGRHGLSRGDPAAADLLGAELVAVLDAPPRRLSVAEINRHVTRIEEL